MTTYERRQSLIELLRKQPGLRVPELAETLDVSEGTVRNDLTALEREGKLTRVHGGGVLNEQSAFHHSSFLLRHQENTDAKLVIAREAARLVQDNESIFLDSSTSAYYFGREISEQRQRLRVITNGIDVAQVLAENSSNTVILIGGVVNNDSSSVTGLLSEQIIKELHIQKAFVSCSGFSLERGMTEVHLAEAQLKRKAMESSQQVIALIDSSKFGKEDLTPFVRPERIAHLITDAGLAPEWAAKLKEAGIDFTVCGQDVVSIK